MEQVLTGAAVTLIAMIAAGMLRLIIQVNRVEERSRAWHESNLQRFDDLNKHIDYILTRIGANGNQPNR